MAYTIDEFAQLNLEKLCQARAKGDDLKRIAEMHGASLPKPPRVEKWQRWRVDNDASHVTEADDMYTEFANGTLVNTGALSRGSCHFLGYAKPDKIEVGQMWQSAAKIPMRVKWTDGDVVMFEAHGFRDCDVSASIMLSSHAYEYLGMAERASDIPYAPANPSAWAMGYGTTATGAIGGAGVARGDSAMAAIRATGELPIPPHKTLPEIYRDSCARRDADLLARGFLAMFSQWLAWSRTPRVQNELAAKRLIANPPDWAYPRAWTCAVLAAKEWRKSDGSVIAGLELRDPNMTWWVPLVMRMMAKDRKAPNGSLEQAMFDAYARGMEKPAPLLQRPRNVMRVR